MMVAWELTGMMHVMCECFSPGTAFNQLAALAGDKNEYLDAVYYYLRRYVLPSISPYTYFIC